MSCGQDLSCARLACEPRPACASSASHAGGFATGSSTGRVSFSLATSAATQGRVHPEPDIRAVLEAQRECERIIDFPVDVFEYADAMPASCDVRIVAFRALLPAVKRIAVHAVERSRASTVALDPRRECYCIYLIDCDGGEHPFLDFTSAGSATYAAMRIAQVYRLSVEFGTFAEPKSRDDSGVARDRDR